MLLHRNSIWEESHLDPVAGPGIWVSGGQLAQSDSTNPVYAPVTLISEQTLPVTTKNVRLGPANFSRKYTIGDADTQLPAGSIIRYMSTTVFTTDMVTVPTAPFVTSAYANIATTTAGGFTYCCRCTYELYICG